jgi:hypothetical protein
MLILSALTVAGTAHADPRDFTLSNKLGFTIKTIQVSEETNPSWEEDILGAGVLGADEAREVTFKGYKGDACKFDVRITNMEDHDWTVRGIDLCTILTLEFFMENGVVKYRTPLFLGE